MHVITSTRVGVSHVAPSRKGTVEIEAESFCEVSFEGSEVDGLKFIFNQVGFLYCFGYNACLAAYFLSSVLIRVSFLCDTTPIDQQKR